MYKFLDFMNFFSEHMYQDIFICHAKDCKVSICIHLDILTVLTCTIFCDTYFLEHLAYCLSSLLTCIQENYTENSTMDLTPPPRTQHPQPQG